MLRLAQDIAEEVRVVMPNVPADRGLAVPVAGGQIRVGEKTTGTVVRYGLSRRTSISAAR